MHITDLVTTTLGLLGLGVFVAGVFRRLPIPYTVMLVLIGVLLKMLAPHVSLLAPIEDFRIDPELVLFIFLPILIFESALTLNARQLIQNIAPVLALAVIGVLISTLLVAVTLTYALNLPFMLAMIFGALISATDPVAVVAMFKSLGAPVRLTTLIEGESLLNDATAIVIFTVFLSMLLAGHTLTFSMSMDAIGEFLEVFVGGAVVGIVGGALVAWLVYILRSNLSEILVLTLMLAYTSFVVADHYLHYSGVMAVVTSAIVIAIFSVPRLRLDDSESVQHTWEFLSLICNTLLFLLMGLSINLQSLWQSGLAILLAFAVILAARAISIYGVLPMVSSIFKLPKFSLSDRHVLWWGGLRGGLAIAMVLSIPETVPGQALLLDLTLGVVLATLIINAPTIQPLMAKLGLNKPNKYECIEIAHTQMYAEHKAEGLLAEFADIGIITKAGFASAEKRITKTFDHGHKHETDEEERINLALTLLQQENKTLKAIFESGVIPQYTYLEIGDELQIRRESIIGGDELSSASLEKIPNFFERTESFIISHLREKNWATNILAWYQNIRHSDHLIRICILLQMSIAAKRFLKQIEDIPDAIMQQRREMLEKDIAYYRQVLIETRASYTEFYRRFMRSFAYRSAAAVAMRSAEKAFKHGIVGAKSYHAIEESVDKQLQNMPKITEPVQDLDAKELIKLVPLYSDLPHDALQAIADAAKAVKFLPGDTVIEQGKKGDALYIIVKGGLRASKKSVDDKSIMLADLYSGEFVGEMALLGDSVRMASVVAILPTTLLRITRGDILKIAEKHPGLRQALENAKRERS